MKGGSKPRSPEQESAGSPPRKHAEAGGMRGQGRKGTGMEEEAPAPPPRGRRQYLSSHPQLQGTKEK